MPDLAMHADSATDPLLQLVGMPLAEQHSIEVAACGAASPLMCLCRGKSPRKATLTD